MASIGRRDGCRRTNWRRHDEAWREILGRASGLACQMEMTLYAPLPRHRGGHIRRIYPKRLGQKKRTRTIAQTRPHPSHVMLGWAACHSRIRLWKAISGYARAFSFVRDSSVTAL
jgi:hypothetical protein